MAKLVPTPELPDRKLQQQMQRLRGGNVKEAVLRGTKCNNRIAARLGKKFSFKF
jgi:hypothetical protein